MRQISLVGDPDWISARELQLLMMKIHNPAKVETAIVEACQLGQIAGRAARMKCIDTGSSSRFDSNSETASMEWDIPIWFWRELVKPDHFQDWRLNKAHGSGRRKNKSIKIELQGVHFHRSGLVNLGLASADSKQSSKAAGGRKPTYDWQASSLAVFGHIHRGDFKPENQADIERALIEHLSDGKSEPSQSTVRPYAKLIWEESQKA